MADKRNLRSNSNDQLTWTYNDILLILDKQRNDIVQIFKDELNKIVFKIEALESRMKIVENSFLEIQLKQKEQVTQHGSLTKKVEEMKSEYSHAILDEMEQRSWRKTNIIISGVVELKQGDVKERQDHDKKYVEELIEDLDMNEIEVQSVSRIGKIGGNKERLMRVKLKSEASKIELLKSARNLKNNTEYKGVYLNPDRTPMEQHRFSILRKELKTRRSNGEDVILYKGQIINKNEIHKNFR